MLYLVIKAGLSGVIVMLVSEVARKFPGFGALIASLPLISVLVMIWLWRDTADPDRLAVHASATFWYVLPSLPMFLLLPFLLKRGIGFWPSLISLCLLTSLLYLVMTWLLSRAGVRL